MVGAWFGMAWSRVHAEGLHRIAGLQQWESVQGLMRETSAGHTRLRGGKALQQGPAARGVALFEVLSCSLWLTAEPEVACTVYAVMSGLCSAWCSSSAPHMRYCLSSGVTASPLRMPGVLWAWLNQSVCCACAWKSQASGPFLFFWPCKVHLCNHISLCAVEAGWADRFHGHPALEACESF